MESLMDFLQDFIANSDFSNDSDYDELFSRLSMAGIDITQFSADEIKEALEGALASQDPLHVSSDDIDSLTEKAGGVERVEHRGEPTFEGRRVCPTRHGCTGIASCDYSYGAPA